jgi:hypothetical protein
MSEAVGLFAAAACVVRTRYSALHRNAVQMSACIFSQALFGSFALPTKVSGRMP